jgi:hypothetical protein
LPSHERALFVVVSHAFPHAAQLFTLAVSHGPPASLDPSIGGPASGVSDASAPASLEMTSDAP